MYMYAYIHIVITGYREKCSCEWRFSASSSASWTWRNLQINVVQMKIYHLSDSITKHYSFDYRIVSGYLLELLAELNSTRKIGEATPLRILLIWFSQRDCALFILMIDNLLQVSFSHWPVWGSRTSCKPSLSIVRFSTASSSVTYLTYVTSTRLAISLALCAFLTVVSRNRKPINLCILKITRSSLIHFA